MDPNEVHWIRPDRRPDDHLPMRVLARYRYRQPLQPATLPPRCEDAPATLVFDTPQSGIAPGQFAAWHDAETGEEVLGSGVIA